MQAIITKYIAASNFKGSRIKASCDRGSLTIGYPHEFNEEEAHIHAARCLCDKFKKEDAKDGKHATKPEENPWGRPFSTGGLPKVGYAHVFTPRYATSVLVQFSNDEDANYFRKYQQAAVKTDGTITGVKAGLMCSALKRSKI